MDLTCKLHILQDLRQAQNARKENELKFCTLKEASTAEIVEKKSRFIANSCHIESKEEAEEKINLIKKKYYDAKHNCFSFSIVDKDGNLLEKSSDDGEPSGTAGAPMLNILQKNELCNILVVVTRYFGGILLGTGGLVRAYSDSLINAIKIAKKQAKILGCEMFVELEYTEFEKFKYYCRKNNIAIKNVNYLDNVTCNLELEEDKKAKLMEDYNNKSINLRDIKFLDKKLISKSIIK